jgi:hypothetical protein
MSTVSFFVPYSRTEDAIILERNANNALEPSRPGTQREGAQLTINVFKGGESSFLEFLSEFYGLCLKLSLKPHERYPHLRILLGGEAFALSQTLVNDNSTEDRELFSSTVSKLAEKYLWHPEPLKLFKSRMESVRMRKKESLRCYTARYECLIHFLRIFEEFFGSIDKVDERRIVECYQKGLSPKVMQRLDELKERQGLSDVTFGTLGQMYALLYRDMRPKPRRRRRRTKRKEKRRKAGSSGKKESQMGKESNLVACADKLGTLTLSDQSVDNEVNALSDEEYLLL